jgi:hypothetical protein
MNKKKKTIFPPLGWIPKYLSPTPTSQLCISFLAPALHTRGQWRVGPTRQPLVPCLRSMTGGPPLVRLISSLTRSAPGISKLRWTLARSPCGPPLHALATWLSPCARPRSPPIEVRCPATPPRVHGAPKHWHVGPLAQRKRGPGTAHHLPRARIRYCQREPRKHRARPGQQNPSPLKPKTPRDAAVSVGVVGIDRAPLMCGLGSLGV